MLLNLVDDLLDIHNKMLGTQALAIPLSHRYLKYIGIIEASEKLSCECSERIKKISGILTQIDQVSLKMILHSYTHLHPFIPFVLPHPAYPSKAPA